MKRHTRTFVSRPNGNRRSRPLLWDVEVGTTLLEGNLVTPNKSTFVCT